MEWRWACYRSYFKVMIYSLCTRISCYGIHETKPFSSHMQESKVRCWIESTHFWQSRVCRHVCGMLEADTEGIEIVNTITHAKYIVIYWQHPAVQYQWHLGTGKHIVTEACIWNSPHIISNGAHIPWAIWSVTTGSHLFSSVCQYAMVIWDHEVHLNVSWVMHWHMMCHQRFLTHAISFSKETILLISPICLFRSLSASM